MRNLIERIVLTPFDGALKVELYGDLARLMAFAEGKELKLNDPGSAGEPGSLLSVVAGARNQRYLHFVRAQVPMIPRPLGM